VNSGDTPAGPLAIPADRVIELPFIGRGPAEPISTFAMTLAALLHVAVPVLFLLHWPAPVPIILPKPIPVALVIAPPPEAPPPPAPPAPKPPPTLPYLQSGPDQQTMAPPPAETTAPEHATPRAEAQASEDPHVNDAPTAAEPAPSAKSAPAESSKARPKPHKEIAHLEPAPKETLKPQAPSLAPPPRHANIRLGDKNESGDPYLNRIMQSIEAHRIYPRVTGQLGLLVEGTAVYAVLVDRSGAILDMRLRHSSGTAGIDTAAESMIRQSGPFPPIPADYPDRLPLEVTLHLVPPS
jgi:periplasmic protein TonB